MSKRFGRNQKRRMREQIAFLKHQQQRAIISEENTALLVNELQLARETYLLIGWKSDCDSVRRIDTAFSKLRNHYLGKSPDANSSPAAA